jgi:hypothetical protein
MLLDLSRSLDTDGSDSERMRCAGYVETRLPVDCKPPAESLETVGTVGRSRVVGDGSGALSSATVVTVRLAVAGGDAIAPESRR